MSKHFTQNIIFSPAYDKRSPNPSENYGIHGVDMRFILTGDKGTVQFVVYTNWYLPHVQKEFEDKPMRNYNPFVPIAADVGYHSPKPMYEGQYVMAESCEYLGGKPCYYDGSVLQAEDYFRTLVSEGGEAVWKRLEDYYCELFEESEAIND